MSWTRRRIAPVFVSRPRILKPVVIVAAALVCVAWSIALDASSTQRGGAKRVLLLHQDAGSPFHARFDAAFIDALRSDETAGPIELFEETVETMRFPGAQQSQLIRDYLRSKYSGQAIDAIVAMGTSAVNFARRNRAFFGDPPIVAAVSPPGQIDPNDNMTGLEGGFWVDATLDLALALRPETHHVVIVDGEVSDDADDQSEIGGQWLRRNPGVQLVYLRDLPIADVVSRISRIPTDSIVLFVRQTMRTATEELDPFDGLAQVVRASPVPVFTANEEFLGRGVVGGDLWRFETDARRMADMARQLALGRQARDVPLSRTTITPIVDWRQLQRWKIADARVPADVQVLFRPPNFWEQHKWVAVWGAIICAGQMALLVGLWVQRLRRRRAEADSRRNADLYRSVIETQSELICRFLPDSTLTFVNDAYCRFWNKARNELLGTHFVDLLPEDARQPVLDRIARLRRGFDSHEHQVMLPDGSVGWQHWINYAILDEYGQLVELQGVGRDITDRVRAEDAIGQLEARNSAMLRAIPDLMFVMTRDGTYIDYHARDPSLLFVPPAAFLGKNVREIMPAPLTDMFVFAIEQACERDEIVVVEYELPLASDVRSFESRVVQAGPDRVLTIVRDVTDSKRALERNRDLAGRLIASQEEERKRIARELHDDLSQRIALLNIEIDQATGQMPSEDLRARLQTISSHIAEIASEVHNLSHELHPSKLQTLGLLAAVQSVCRNVGHQAGLRVVFTHGKVPRMVDLDVSLCLYRIVQEALHNVTRHSHADEVRVHLTSHENDLTLQLVDSGVGFDPQAQHDGLGLIGMRERVAFLRGELAIHSAPGEGTHIEVRVPMVPPKAAADVSAETEQLA